MNTAIATTNPLRNAIGLGPLYFALGIPVAIMLIMGVVAWHTMRYGPSYPIGAIDESVMIDLHENDAEYATAIAERFLNQYLVYHHNSFSVTRSRAAYLCTAQRGQDCLAVARQRTKQVLDTKESSQIEILASKVVWQGDGSYIIAVLLERSVWIGPFLREKALYKATVDLVPRPPTQSNIFMMAVQDFRLDPYEPKLAEPAADEAKDAN